MTYMPFVLSCICITSATVENQIKHTNGYIITQVDRGRLWLFEQEQALGFSNVTTVVRMTVIKLESGGLWIHAPVAPTRCSIAY